MNKRVKNSKGQVTIFIIVAVIVVGLGVTFFVFRGSLGTKNDVPQEVSPLINFVQECIDSTLEETVYNIAKQGGYSGYSYLSKETTDSGINYYLFEGRTSFPSKGLVENQIEEYFERKFFLCAEHFVSFQDYQIEEGNLETSVTMRDEEIIMNVNYPLTINKGESSLIVKAFESRVSSRFGILYNSVIDFIKQQEDNERVCLTCLDLAIKNEIYVNMESSYDGTVVFTFRDNSSELNNNPLEWIFANKY